LIYRYGHGIHKFSITDTVNAALYEVDTQLGKRRLGELTVCLIMFLSARGVRSFATGNCPLSCSIAGCADPGAASITENDKRNVDWDVQRLFLLSP